MKYDIRYLNQINKNIELEYITTSATIPREGDILLNINSESWLVHFVSWDFYYSADDVVVIYIGITKKRS